jgi:uncharacterized protein (TIGR03083 family)
LAGLNPFDLLDAESSRVERFFAACTDADWRRPTRCAEWNVRDMLGHLTFVEDYNQAGLDGTVKRLIAASGASDLDAINAWGVAQRANMSTAYVLAEWRRLNAAYRREMRARGTDGTIDTMVGTYPSWQQAFYLANEYATHADDMGVPLEAAEAAQRLAWRVRFTRYAVQEYARPVTIVRAGATNVVTGATDSAELTDAELVDAGVARLPADHPLPDSLRQALGCMA